MSNAFLGIDWLIREMKSESGFSFAIASQPLQKVKAQILLDFDRNHMKLFGTDEKLLKDLGENISVQCIDARQYAEQLTNNH